MWEVVLRLERGKKYVVRLWKKSGCVKVKLRGKGDMNFGEVKELNSSVREGTVALLNDHLWKYD